MTAARPALTALVFALVFAPRAPAQDILHDQTALLRESPKHFVTIVEVDAQKRMVELRLEGQEQTQTFAIEPDAEVKIHGTWGRLDQLIEGDRAWIWVYPQKAKERGRVFVIADEISEQEIHGLPWEITGADAANRRVSLRRQFGKKAEQKRELQLHPSIAIATEGDLIVFSSTGDAAAIQAKFEVKPGDRAFVRTADGVIRWLLSREATAALTRNQELLLRADLRDDGLPGTVAANHPFAGEIEVMVDHEAMRWARFQQPGARVTLGLDKPLEGVLRHVEAWHEKTRLRIATRGPNLANVRVGDRIRVKVKEPPLELLNSDLPVDLGRAEGRAPRIEWFLANTYCSCTIDGDGCTGMFYTLASCNTTRCGMPKRIRTFVGEQIDKGIKDTAILAELRKTHGPLCLKPHLLR